MTSVAGNKGVIIINSDAVDQMGFLWRVSHLQAGVGVPGLFVMLLILLIWVVIDITLILKHIV